MVFLACGAKHKLVDNLVFKDEGFAYDNLKKYGLIVGGMSSDVVEVSREDRLEYSTTFSNVLIEKLKDVSMIKITNPRQLMDNLGQDQYFTMLEDLDDHKALSREWADTLSMILPNTRYILFAYIVNENIVDESRDYVEESEEGEDYTQREYKKTYFITVDFLLYDLLRKELVWENSIFNQAQRTESRSTQTGCMESCVNDIIQQILFGEAAEISREEVFIKIVEKFAEDISKS
jgi:hypothetical protein